MLLALHVKVGKVASFVGKIFMVRPSTTKTTNILLHENYLLYGSKIVWVVLIETDNDSGQVIPLYNSRMF